MKISPVQGTAIGNIGSDSGVTPDKAARAKAILMGQPSPEAAEEEKEVVPQVAPNSNQVIKMRTNANPEAIDAALQETAPEVKTEPESAVSDTSAQTKPAPEAIQQVSPQIAALAKEKRALQVKAKELSDKESGVDERIRKALALEEQIKNGHALSALLERGVTYDDLTSQILNRQNSLDPAKLEEKILEGVRKELAAKDTAQEEAVFEHMSKNVNRMAYGSNDFPFIKAGKAMDKVMDLIKRSWHGDKDRPDIFPGGEVLDEEEALQMIEAELKDDAKAYAKLLGTEPTTQSPVEQQPKTQPITAQRAAIKTLTNKDTARAGMNRRQRAIAAALGQIK